MRDQDAIDQFHRDGVLVVRDVLDAAEVAALRADVDATVAKGVTRKGKGTAIGTSTDVTSTSARTACGDMAGSTR